VPVSFSAESDEAIKELSCARAFAGAEAIPENDAPMAH